MIATSLFALAGCVALSAGADHVTAGDLASALPVFAAAPPETPVGLAPNPGVRRDFRLPELQRLAARLDLASAPDAEVCVERPVLSPDPARWLAAMREQLPGARIEILDYSRAPAPEGEIEFPLSGLRRGPGPSLWTGRVRYAPGRSLPLWAKVDAKIQAQRVVAKRDLPAGRTVEAADWSVETREEAPTEGGFVSSLEDVSGRILSRAVKAGAALRNDMVKIPTAIAKGETVRVQVWNGGARLELEAQAQAAGGAGQMIPVVNPASKKRFLARVEGRGRVSVGAPAERKVEP